MDFETYQQYLRDWSEHRSLELRFEVGVSIVESILSSLYQVYSNFATQYAGYRIRLLHEKFIYDRSNHRHGFHTIFEVMKRGGQTERIGVMAYIRNHSQQILNRYREQFQIMSHYIFGPTTKMSLKIRSNPDTSQFVMVIQITPELEEEDGGDGDGR